MKPIKKILVPTDFSEQAHVALERALALRQQSGAELTLLHVYQLPISYPNGFAFTMDLSRSLEDASRSAMTRELATAEAHARDLSGGAPVGIATKITVGAPAQGVVEEAKTGGYDLVVMGTHGRTGIGYFFIGSVAERVVRAASCSVLVVR